MTMISLLSTITQIHSDGTFKMVPKLFNQDESGRPEGTGQLYTLHAKAYDKVF